MLLHPQFLWGLTGVAVPVLIHLLARRRARRVPFPSLRLLRAAERKRRTFARLQRPLSLLLRMLAIALLALALAAPVVGPLPGWMPLPRTHAVAVLLDDSLSMTARVGGASAFERANKAADALLGSMGSADRAGVVPTSEPDEARLGRPAEAREWLRERRPTASSGRLGPAFLRAAEVLGRADSPNRTIIVLTDLQATAWRDPPVSVEGLAGLDIIAMDVGDERADNLAIGEVELLTRSSVVGRPVRLRATASASAASPTTNDARKIVMQFLLGDEPVAASEQEISIATPAAAQFSLVPDAAQDLSARVALTAGPHGPGMDDVRYCTIRARPTIDALIAAAGGVGRYIATALDPFGDSRKAGIAAREIEPSRLSKVLAEDGGDLAILANCPALEQEDVEALQEHVETGGGLLIFLGDGADASFLQERLIPELTAGASLRVGPVETAPPGAPFALTEIDTAREPLSVFESPRAGDLGALRFTKARKLEAGDRARVLATFDNGSPALVEWPAGRGRVILFNTSADASWGEHIRSAAYVPLMHRLCGYLARPARPAIADVLVGERPAITGTGPPPSDVTLVYPGGDERTIPVEDGLLPEVKGPGGYRARWDKTDIAFAVNVDSAESDLTRTEEASVRTALAPAAVGFVRPDIRPEELVARLPAKADLSLALLLCALAVILVESVFSIVRRGSDDASGLRPVAGAE